MSRERGTTLTVGRIATSYLKSRGYDTTVLDGGSRSVFSSSEIVGEPRDCQLVVYEDSRVVRFFVKIPESFAPTRRAWVQQLVAIANEELSVFGFFVLSENLGLYYHVAARIAEDDSLPIEVMESLFVRSAFPLKTFDMALGRVNRNDVSPAAAIQASLIEGAAKDGASATKSVRKALLTLLK